MLKPARWTGVLGVVGGGSLVIAAGLFSWFGGPVASGQFVDLGDYAAQLPPLVATLTAAAFATAVAALLSVLVRLVKRPAGDDMGNAWLWSGAFGTGVGLGLVLGAPVYLVGVAAFGRNMPAIMSTAGLVALGGVFCLVFGALPLAVGLARRKIITWPEAVFFGTSMVAGFVAGPYLQTLGVELPRALVAGGFPLLLYGVGWLLVGIRVMTTREVT